MNSKLGLMFMAIVVAIILFFLGGFVLSNKLGMACVMIAIFIVGWTAGNVMDTPCETAGEKESV